MYPALGFEGLAVNEELGAGVAEGILESAFDLQRRGASLLRIAGQLDPARAWQVRMSMSSIGIAVTGLFAACDTKCTLAGDPVPVRTRPEGPNDDMITRCEHDPAHCWDGSGRKIDCP
jgi:hypothetical protein